MVATCETGGSSDYWNSDRLVDHDLCDELERNHLICDTFNVYDLLFGNIAQVRIKRFYVIFVIL